MPRPQPRPIRMPRRARPRQTSTRARLSFIRRRPEGLVRYSAAKAADCPQTAGHRETAPSSKSHGVRSRRARRSRRTYSHLGLRSTSAGPRVERGIVVRLRERPVKRGHLSSLSGRLATATRGWRALPLSKNSSTVCRLSARAQRQSAASRRICVAAQQVQCSARGDGKRRGIGVGDRGLAAAGRL